MNGGVTRKSNKSSRNRTNQVGSLETLRARPEIILGTKPTVEILFMNVFM